MGMMRNAYRKVRNGAEFLTFRKKKGFAKAKRDIKEAYEDVMESLDKHNKRVSKQINKHMKKHGHKYVYGVGLTGVLGSGLYAAHKFHRDDEDEE